jgi:hypothetical protein
MPFFSKDDFTRDTATRLMVIIMKQMGRPPLTQFNELPPSQKTKFNRLMNEYIQDLGENWDTKLLFDFNQIVNEDILNEDFDAGRVFVRDTLTERKLLLSQEQTDWIKDETSRTGETPLY